MLTIRPSNCIMFKGSEWSVVNWFIRNRTVGYYKVKKGVVASM